MGSINTVIPRFLLPQITWKASISQSLKVTSQRQPCPSAPLLRCKDSRRSISTQARIWQNKSPISGSCSKILHSLTNRHVSSHLSSLPPTKFRSAPFSTTLCRPRDHHFDTLKFVQRLKDEGFSEDQSRAMMLVLSDVIEESIQNLTRTMVLREGKLVPPRPPFEI